MVFDNKLLRAVKAAEASLTERKRYISLGFIKPGNGKLPGQLDAAELSRRGFYDASTAVARRERFLLGE